MLPLLVAKYINWVSTRRGRMILLFLFRGMMEMMETCRRYQGIRKCRKGSGAIYSGGAHVRCYKFKRFFIYKNKML